MAEEMKGAEQALAMAVDIAEKFDAITFGKPMQLVCVALSLELVAQLKAAKYPGVELIDELEKFILIATVAIGDAADKEIEN
jgi:hypothetical protein